MADEQKPAAPEFDPLDPEHAAMQAAMADLCGVITDHLRIKHGLDGFTLAQCFIQAGCNVLANAPLEDPGMQDSVEEIIQATDIAATVRKFQSDMRMAEAAEAATKGKFDA